MNMCGSGQLMMLKMKTYYDGQIPVFSHNKWTFVLNYKQSVFQWNNDE